jgi:Mce-associated membrane protein
MTTSGTEDAVTVEEASRDGEIVDYDPESESQPTKGRRITRILAFGVLPGLALMLAAGAGYSKWQSDTVHDSAATRAQSVQAATESTIAILSYQPDTADKQLNGARDRLAEPFRDQYTKLISDVVIPGAKQKKISAIATVPAAASISSTPKTAQVLVFIDQSIVIGTDAPTSTASTVRVTLQKDRDRWLISQFDPV